MTSTFKQATGKSLGKFISYKNIPSGIHAETTFGKFKVLVYTQSIIRISATVDETFEDFSYSVVSKPADVHFEISENTQSLTIKTSACSLVISKDPVRPVFRKKSPLKSSDSEQFQQGSLLLVW